MGKSSKTTEAPAVVQAVPVDMSDIEEVERQGGTFDMRTVIVVRAICIVAREVRLLREALS